MRRRRTEDIQNDTREENVSRQNGVSSYSNLRTLFSSESVRLSDLLKSEYADLLDTLEEIACEIKEEASFWKEALTAPLHEDPVWLNLEKSMDDMESFVRILSASIIRFTLGFHGMVEGIEGMGEAFGTYVSGGTNNQLDEETPYRQACAIQFRESCNAIGRRDAPTSVVSIVVKRIKSEIMGPLKLHIRLYNELRIKAHHRLSLLDEWFINNKEVKNFESRGLFIATRVGSGANDPRADHAHKMLIDSVSRLAPLDRELYAWMVVLQDYRDDLLDSFMQTVREIQIDMSKRMLDRWEHRVPSMKVWQPLKLLEPKEIEKAVKTVVALLEIEDRGRAAKELDGAAERVANDVLTSATARHAERQGYPLLHGPLVKFEGEGGKWLMKVIPPTNKNRQKSMSVRIDPVSVKLLLSSGLDELEARAALRATGGSDIQAALEWHLAGGDSDDDDIMDNPLVVSGSIMTRHPRSQKYRVSEFLMREYRDIVVDHPVEIPCLVEDGRLVPIAKPRPDDVTPSPVIPAIPKPEVPITTEQNISAWQDTLDKEGDFDGDWTSSEYDEHAESDLDVLDELLLL